MSAVQYSWWGGAGWLCGKGGIAGPARALRWEYNDVRRERILHVYYMRVLDDGQPYRRGLVFTSSRRVADAAAATTTPSPLDHLLQALTPRLQYIILYLLENCTINTIRNAGCVNVVKNCRYSQLPWYYIII